MPQKKQMERSCMFCQANVRELNYKDTRMLQRYISSFGKIVPNKRSGACTWHQRKLALAIKRARFMSLLPFAVK